MNIAIVGNKRVTENVSRQVDAADVVIRISKMNHLDSGLVGVRTDELYLEPNAVWWVYSKEARRLDLVRDIPHVYIRESWWLRNGGRLFDEGILRADGQVHVIPAEVEDGLKGCTTFAMAVYDVHLRFPEAIILAAGADFGQERDRVFAFHAASGENSYMEGLIKAGVLVPI